MPNTVRFDKSDIVNDTQKVVTSTWTNNTNNLTTAFTSSTQASFGSATSSGAHYIEVYNAETGSTSAAVQYSVLYGHKEGSGSLDFTNDTGAIGNSPSRNVYNQYRQLVFGDESSTFQFNDYTPDDIYVINLNRARYKHNLKPGTLDLQISGGSGLTTLHLTDDSVSATGSSTTTNIGRQFNIVSGTLGIMSGSVFSQVVGSGSYGLFYPEGGFLILNPAALDHNIEGVTPGTSQNTADNNPLKLLQHISTSGNFILDSEERVSSQYYFVRAKNNQFNYTTNPSFIDTNGNVNITSFIDNPTTYITTVGLYNDNNDLVAVAKLSQPITKDFTKESLIRVKLDY
tara:strand:+ start:1592 stop:2620 length:1029 start_codon:yes stop_codon:yes gene_type:complete